MKLSGLEVRVTHRERCPYCHDALGEVERVACAECGTPHHPACLAELGVCTVLGCPGEARRPLAAGPVDELRSGVQGRVRRYPQWSSRHALAENAETVRRRLTEMPPFCTECLKGIRVLDCPQCHEPLSETCERGSARHCANRECWPYYDALSRKVGAPIDVEGYLLLRKRGMRAGLTPILVGLLALSLLGVAILYVIALMLL